MQYFRACLARDGRGGLVAHRVSLILWLSRLTKREMNLLQCGVERTLDEVGEYTTTR